MATIVFDGTTGQMTTGDMDGVSSWVVIPGPRSFGGSATYPPFATKDDLSVDSGNYGTLKVTFQGTSIAFIGNTPEAYYSQNIFVSIDGRPTYETWYSDPSPPCSLQWYQSPMLSDGEHTINITHIAGTSVDMIMVTAGQSTSLSGQQLIVDDDDEAIAYSGSWARKTGLYHSSDLPHTGQPFGNATHQASSVGASATFKFIGTSVAVYSVFDYSHLGSLSVTFTLDSIPYSKTYSVMTDTSEYVSGTLQRQNMMLWSSDIIPAEQHTLDIELTGSTNGAALVLDYLVYTASFNSLAEIPPSRHSSPTVTRSTASTASPLTISQSSTQSRGTTTSGTSSSTMSVNSTSVESATASFDGHSTVWGTVTSTVTGNDAAIASQTGEVSASSTPSGRGVPIGALIGAIVGGVALLALLLLLVLCRKRISKRKSVTPSPLSSNLQPGANLSMIEPFRGAALNDTPVMAEKGQCVSTSMAGLRSLNPFSSDEEHTAVTGSRSYSAPATRAMTSEKTSLSPFNPRSINSGLSSIPSSPSNFASPVSDISINPQCSVQHMQSLENIVSEFNHAVLVHGQASARVAELQTQISELTRRNTGDGALEPLRRDTVGTMAVPPPYEPRGH